MKFYIQIFLNSFVVCFFFFPRAICPVLLCTLLGAALRSPRLRAVPCKRAAAHEVAELALESSVW